MFNNLVESVSDVRRSAKQSTFFGVTAFINIALLVAVFVWSLYSFDLTAFGQNDDLAVNTLVTPVTLPEKAPEPVEMRQTQKSANQSESKSFETLRNPVADINTACKPPADVSSVKPDVDVVRDGVPYVVGDVTRRIGSDSQPTRISPPDNGLPAIALKRQDKADEEELTAPPVSKPKSAPEVKKVTNVSKGVINGLAVVLPKPAYPPMAKQGRIAGAVNVQVMIDEEGRVISASAVSGHPLLRAAAVQTARQAKFTPTKLSEQPVKVTGVIIYNFVPQ